MKKNYIAPLCEDVNFGSENVMVEYFNLHIQNTSTPGVLDAD